MFKSFVAMYKTLTLRATEAEPKIRIGGDAESDHLHDGDGVKCWNTLDE